MNQTTLTDVQKQRLLDRCADAQANYWDLTGLLEDALGIEIDGQDLSGLTVEELIEVAQEEN